MNMIMNMMIMNTIVNGNRIINREINNQYPGTIKRQKDEELGYTLEEINHTRKLKGLPLFTEEEWYGTK